MYIPGAGCLYDLVLDPNETTDISSEQPQLAAALLSRLEDLRKGVYAPDRGIDTFEIQKSLMDLALKQKKKEEENEFDNNLTTFSIRLIS